MGLGSADLVSLAEARSDALEARKLVRQGIDPIEHRRAQRRDAGVPTFSKAAETYIEGQRKGWRNEKHASQWENTLRTYAKPVIGELPVDAITTDHILSVLQDIWHKKPETASRLRGRIERILDWAATRDYRQGENPARWKRHLEHSLPPPRRIRQVRHHRSLPWQELPTLYSAVSELSGIAAQALQFAVLTAGRTGEVRGARWEEFDVQASVPVWTIPGERMKAGRGHRVPLAPPVLKLIGGLDGAESGFLFEARPGKPISENTMLSVLKRLERTDITVHGFRSTFRNWCAEQTAFPREVAEAALAHVNKDRVEAAYLRSDLFVRRYQLMKSWADYVAEMREIEILEFPATIP